MLYMLKYPGSLYITESWDKLMARMVSLPDGTPCKGGTLISSDPDDILKQRRRG